MATRTKHRRHPARKHRRNPAHKHRRSPAVTESRRPHMGYVVGTKKIRRRKLNPSDVHRRSYRRNPDGAGTAGFLKEAAYVTGGFVGNRLVGGFLLPMVPQLASTPILKIAAKGVTAWGLGYAARMLLGSRAGNLIMVGGFVDALDEAVKTYVAPFLPALAGSDMAAYPSLPMGAYPSLGNYTDPYGNAVVGAEFSTADEV